MRSFTTALAASVCLGFAMQAPIAKAQNWVPLNFPANIIDWGNFYLDTATNELYASGINQVISGRAGLFRRNGAAWDTIGYFGTSPYVSRAVHYHDTLIVGGGFSMVGDDTIRACAYYDGSAWHPYGEFDQDALIWNLRILDGELYAVGGFDHVDGQPADGIAKRVGGHWEPVGDFGEVSFPYLFDVIKYDGKLVCCGNMDIVGESYYDVFVFENDEWGPLGGGLYGTFSGGWVMTIYNGELILGGGFYLSAGNAGQCIMRWNGSIWQPLGVGTTDDGDDYSSAPNIHALVVHEGKLFVGGGFSYAGHVPAQGIAVWDGDVWCGLGSSLGLVHDIVFYNDTLFAMQGNWPVDGQTTTGGVRYLHTTYDDTCSLGAGSLVPELSVAPLSVMLDQERLSIIGLVGANSLILLDATGRIHARTQVQAVGGQAAQLPIAGMATGIYILQLNDGRAVRFAIGE